MFCVAVKNSCRTHFAFGAGTRGEAMSIGFEIEVPGLYLYYKVMPSFSSPRSLRFTSLKGMTLARTKNGLLTMVVEYSGSQDDDSGRLFSMLEFVTSPDCAPTGGAPIYQSQLENITTTIKTAFEHPSEGELFKDFLRRLNGDRPENDPWRWYSAKRTSFSVAEGAPSSAKTVAKRPDDRLYLRIIRGAPLPSVQVSFSVSLQALGDKLRNLELIHPFCGNSECKVERMACHSVRLVVKKLTTEVSRELLAYMYCVILRIHGERIRSPDNIKKNTYTFLPRFNLIEAAAVLGPEGKKAWEEMKERVIDVVVKDESLERDHTDPGFKDDRVAKLIDTIMAGDAGRKNACVDESREFPCFVKDVPNLVFEMRHGVPLKIKDQTALVQNLAAYDSNEPAVVTADDEDYVARSDRGCVIL
ncbi:MAG: hypothetical protein JWN04_4061 [Myxococcaceae bacterium]|nr:hypothetical protein [Myxococcaceae bacterium]